MNISSSTASAASKFSFCSLTFCRTVCSRITLVLSWPSWSGLSLSAVSVSFVSSTAASAMLGSELVIVSCWISLELVDSFVVEYGERDSSVLRNVRRCWVCCRVLPSSGVVVVSGVVSAIAMNAVVCCRCLDSSKYRLLLVSHALVVVIELDVGLSTVNSSDVVFCRFNPV